MPTDLTSLSKFMSLILRHRAQAFGLTPDAEGYVPLADLVKLVEANHSLNATKAEMLTVVETGQPKRYEIRVDPERGELIRATYGHSKAKKLGTEVQYPPVIPPETLFHGTVPQALPSIRERGLRAMSRQYVHLSTSPERAQTVAGRRAKLPVILIVRAGLAHANGVVFYAPEPKHFLAQAIPPEFILFPESD